MDPCPVLIGREKEMAALRALLDAGGGVAIVSGEAGIGKSRLVREFAAEAASRGRVVLWGRPEEVAQPGPYALIIDLLESIAERGETDVRRDAQFVSVALTGTATSDGERSSPSARSLAAEIRGLASRLESPPMYVLEDLQRADESSHAVLLHLARSARDDAHCVVVTYRSEMLDGAPSLGRLLDMVERERLAEVINLSALSADQVTEMLELLVPNGLDESVRTRITALGEGIPFFIEELADAASVGAVPRSVELTVENRLQGLGEQARESIRTASLLVGVIEPEILASALQLDRATLTQDLLRATHAGLLVDRGGRLIFRHSLVRDAVSAGIVSVRRRELHSKIALAIENAFAPGLEPHSAALAQHWDQSGDPQRAARFHLMAGDRALALAATAEARSHFVAAAQDPDVAKHARRGLAEVEFREGNDEEAVHLFRTLANELTAMGDLQGAARMLSRLAWALRNKEASEAVFETLDEALRLLDGLEDAPILVELLVQKGQILSFHFGRFTEAKPILERAIAMAHERRDLALVAQASDGLAQVADAEGHADGAIVHGETAMGAALESGIAEVIGRTHNNHAVKLASFGHPKEGLRVLAQGRDHLLRTYGSAGVSVIDVSAAWTSWLMGLPNEVALLTARGQAAWQRWRGYRHILDIWSAIELGQIRQAQARLESAWNGLGGVEIRERFLQSPTESEYEARQLLYAEGLFLIHVGNANRAVKLARSIVAFDRESFGESFDVGQGLILLANGLVHSDYVAEAQQTVEQSEGLLHPIQRYPYLHAHLMELRAMIATAKNDFQLALENLADALVLLTAAANESDRARCERRSAEVSLMLDSDAGRARAIEHLKNGLRIADGCGAAAEKNRIESGLRSLGVRPRAGRPRRTDQSQLTPREVEVAVLVAAGTTNARIAEELYLSERTVQDHITNALRKLGVSGRAGLAAWAARQGLV